MPTHTWKGHTIEVTSYATPRLLWFGISFSVLVDGTSSFRSPDHFEGLGTIVPFEIRDTTEARRGRVESGRPCSVLRASYRVILDEQEIGSGVVRARNWYVTYGIILAAVIVIFCLLYVKHHLKHPTAPISYAEEPTDRIYIYQLQPYRFGACGASPQIPADASCRLR
jgi:hypothetical protein